MKTPQDRIVSLNDHSLSAKGDYVLYWMTSARRPHFNFGLQRAAEYCQQLKKPLLIFEALRCDYRWASVRMHRFVLDGMLDHWRYFKKHTRAKQIYYLPYVERAVGEGRGFLKTLSDKACVVVTDEFPCYFLPRMIESAAQQVSVLMESVDSNGIFPLRATDKAYTKAHSFRAMLQKRLPKYIDVQPDEEPLAKALKGLPAFGSAPKSWFQKWPKVTQSFLEKWPRGHDLSKTKIDSSIAASFLKGGFVTAESMLRDFVGKRLKHYLDRNHPEKKVSTELSPYLHFGHVSAHGIFQAVAKKDGWKSQRLGDSMGGRREGWWKGSEAFEGFVDELITWRELGYGFCFHVPNYDAYESLPDWAQKTLAEHASDPRQYKYTLKQLWQAESHDDIWNAAQRQLLREGRIHNYLRMLWGKRILEWTEDPRQALEFMIELNNGLALDGRNPNSYSGIFWVLGRFDRAWGPERPIFGKVRYMSSANTKKKLKLGDYLETYGPR